jgi:hypothetical protein
MWCALNKGSFSFIYSLRGQFPPSFHKETWQTNLGRIRSNHQPKCTQTGGHPGLADPLVDPMATAFCLMIDRCVLILSFRYFHLGTSVCSDIWALFVSVMQDGIFCVFLRCPLHVFSLFCTCEPKMARWTKQLWG